MDFMGSVQAFIRKVLMVASGKKVDFSPAMIFDTAVLADDMDLKEHILAYHKDL